MKKNELTNMTVAELKALAKKKRVSLPAGVTKPDIIKALSTSAKVAKPAAKKAASPKKPVAAKSVKAGARPAAKKTTVARRTLTEKLPKAATMAREWKTPSTATESVIAQERVLESKFFTGVEQKPAVASSGELPNAYGLDKIALMTRDPHVAFAYWEATPSRIQREKAWFGWDSKLCVRVYDITGIQFDGRNAIGYFDQEVYEQAGNWYFDLGRPNHSFCADLGLLSPDGRFLTLARSNYIAMPRDGVSDVIDEEWMLLDEEFMKLYGVPGGLSSPQLQEMVKRRRELELTSPGTFSRPRPKRK
jgi:hypothetical protein